MSIELSNLISDGMVIQKKAKIWGYTTDEKEVIVEFNNKKFPCVVSNGYFETTVVSEDFGGPFRMKINELVIEDVYVGYVFLCSGQSNMELPISRVRIKYEEELEGVDNKYIRAFNVERNNAFSGIERDCIGKWNYANKDTIDEFYALSYFFGEDLEKYLGIPIGLINCAVGGSNVKSWLSEDLLKAYPTDYELLKKCQVENYVKNVEESDLIRSKEWHEEVNSMDIGIKENFTSNSYDFTKWEKREVTKSWLEDMGITHGSLWFKVTVLLEEKDLDKNATLFLGTLKDSDITFFNGVEVGATGYEYPPRIYNIDKSLLKLGENIITVRLYSQSGIGGFTVDKERKLVFDDGTLINLPKQWYYKIGFKTSELKPATYFWGYPTGLYNGMLYPTLNYSVSGFLWYQGESNTYYPDNYDELQGKLVNQVRDRIGEETPFLVVQLPNFEAYQENYKWEIFREKQASILNFKNTALINTIGLGEDNDIHPLNKKDIGVCLSDSIKTILFNKNNENDRVFISKVK